jgi:hypothetical protein
MTWMVRKVKKYDPLDKDPSEYYKSGRTYTLRGLIDFMRGHIKEIDYIDFDTSVTTEYQRALSSYFFLLNEAYKK